MTTLYKICARELWQQAEANSTFTGAPVDRSDGFIHFSTADQVAETAAKHFAGQADLVLVAIDQEKLGNGLRYEVSRGGALFPHFYGHLDIAAVKWVRPLPLDTHGRHIFPALEA